MPRSWESGDTRFGGVLDVKEGSGRVRSAEKRMWQHCACAQSIWSHHASVYIVVIVVFSSYEVKLGLYINSRRMMMMPCKSASVLLRRCFTFFVKLPSSLENITTVT